MAGERLFFPSENPRDVAELADWVRRYIVAPTNENRTTITRAIGTTETAVPHGGRSVPRWLELRAKGAVAVGESRPPDVTSIYLIAASPVDVEIEVEF